MSADISQDPDDLTIGQALSDFYQKQGMAPDGGVNDRWIKLRFGKYYIPFPNDPARRKAVRYHDIHHLLAGYPTTWRGEAGVGAWEIASGCGDYRAAWIFDLGIFALGLFLFPVTVFGAFIRGRRMRNFYYHTHTYDQIREMKVGEARAVLAMDEANIQPASAAEIVTFLGWWLLAFILSFLMYVAPVVFIVWCIKHW